MWTIAKIIEAVNGEYFTKEFPLKEVSGISTDTRTLKPGELFVALPGENFDGHKFLFEAQAKGAACALVSQPALEVPQDWVITVPDTLKAYQALAAHYRSEFPVKIVAVTGSCGKTTTKDLTAHILSSKYAVLKTPKNLNNDIGIPAILLELKPEHEILVAEMGMRGKGEIALLAELTRPEVGVVTNVAETHYQRLGSQQAIAEAKSELLDALPSDGTAVLNADDAWYDELAMHCKCGIITFGIQNPAAVKLQHYEPLGLMGSYLKIQTRSRVLETRTRLLGRHQAYNLLAAMAVAEAFKLNLDNLEEVLANYNSSSERMQVKKSKKGFQLLYDAYNSNPLALNFTLQTFKELPLRGRKIAVLGDMLELGAIAEQRHTEAGQQVAQGGIDMLITVGEFAQFIAQGARQGGMPQEQVWHFKDNEDAARFMQKNIQANDIILLKASRGMAFEEIEKLILPERDNA